jgi:ABC-type Fe3+-hydroxamate transport system substrate-binding protein
LLRRRGRASGGSVGLGMSVGVRDAFGKPFALEAPARRIVSLIPSITEILFSLGAGDQVVGVTKFCTEPPEGIARKAKVGGPKNPRRDLILGLMPELVVANVEENHRSDVEAIRAAGVPVFVTYPRTVRDGIQLTRDLGALVGKTSSAEAIATSCEEALAAIEPRNAGRERVRVFCPIWRRPYMTINADTYMDSMLWTCGGENIFRDQPARYPTVDLAQMAALRPDMVLLPDEPYPFGRKHLEEFRDLADVPAVRAGRLHLLDGKILSWYGPRIAESLQTLTEILHAGSEGWRGGNDQ